MGYDNSVNSQFDAMGGGGGVGGSGGGGVGGYSPSRPVGSRCDEDNTFKQIGSRQRVRRQYVKRIVPAASLLHCQRECIETKDFICRSFNYRDVTLLYESDPATAVSNSNSGREREREVTNCELSDRDTRELDLQNPTMFDSSSFDYYERSNARSGSDSECLDGEWNEIFESE